MSTSKRIGTLLVAALVLIPSIGFSQSGAQTNTSTGITTTSATNLDRDGRTPILSVTSGTNTQLFGNPVELRISATVENDTYENHPIRVEIYVAGKHFESFLTTSRRPIPIAAFIGDDVFDRSGGRPMDITILASTVHVNRTFTSMVEITVYNQNFSGTFDCTYVATNEADTSTTYVANGVNIVQRSESQIELSESFNAVDGSQQVTVTTVLSLNSSDSTISGTVQVTENGTSSVVGLTGTFDREEENDNSLESFSISQADGGGITLSCS